MDGVDGGKPGLGEGADREEVIGVVLCGGASRRMGADKGSLRLGEGELLDRVVEVLDGVCDEVALACGTEERYADRGLRLVMDSKEGQGPMEGIAASLESTRAEWVVVLACDLPGVVMEVPKALLERARNEDLDACLLESRRGMEPLIAVYRSTCLAPMREALAEGLRRVDSFHARERADGVALRIGALPEGELPDEIRRLDVARNLNTPMDLATERARHAEVLG